LSDQELADQELADHDDADQELADHDDADQELADHELADHDDAIHGIQAPSSHEFARHDEASNPASPVGSVWTSTPLRLLRPLQVACEAAVCTKPAPDPHRHSGSAIVRIAA
jgi:hypothetical protein